jgi:hypothetical protein
MDTVTCLSVTAQHDEEFSTSVTVSHVLTEAGFGYNISHNYRVTSDYRFCIVTNYDDDEYRRLTDDLFCYSPTQACIALATEICNKFLVGYDSKLVGFVSDEISFMPEHLRKGTYRIAFLQKDYYDEIKEAQRSVYVFHHATIEEPNGMEADAE